MRRRPSSPFSLFSFQDIITSVTGVIILLTLILALELTLRKAASPAGETSNASVELQRSIVEASAEIKRLERQLTQGAEAAEEFARTSPETLRREGPILREQAARLKAEAEQLKQRDGAFEKEEERLVAEQQARQDRDRDEFATAKARREDALDKLGKLRKSNRLIYNRNPDDTKQAWLVEVTSGQFTAAPIGRATRPTVFTDTSLTRRVKAFLEFARGRDRDREYFVLLVKPDGIDGYQQLRAGLEGSGIDLGFDLVGTDHAAIDPVTGAGYQ